MEFTVSEYGFEGVLRRLKEQLQEKTDAAVAERLGLSPSAFNNRKKSGSVPYGEIVSLAGQTQIDLVYVLTGTQAKGDGDLHVAQESHGYAARPAVVNAELLQKILCAVDKELAQRELHIPTKKKAELIVLLYDHFTERGTVDEERFTRFMDLVLER